MNAKALIEELSRLPGDAEVYVKFGDGLRDAWLCVDSVAKLEAPEIIPGLIAVETTTSPANWPLFREGR